MKKIFLSAMLLLCAASVPAFALKTIYNEPTDLVVPSRSVRGGEEISAMQTNGYVSRAPRHTELIRVRYTGDEIRPELIGTTWKHITTYENGNYNNGANGANGANVRFVKTAKYPTRYIREAADYYIQEKR